MRIDPRWKVEQRLIVWVLGVAVWLSACGDPGPLEQPQASPAPSVSSPLPAPSAPPTSQAERPCPALDAPGLPVRAADQLPASVATVLPQFVEVTRPGPAGCGLPIVVPTVLPAAYEWEWTADTERPDTQPPSYNYVGELQGLEGSESYTLVVDVTIIDPTLPPPGPDSGYVIEDRLSPVGDFPIYRQDPLGEMMLYFRVGSVAVHVSLSATCSDEQRWVVGDGVCLSWDDLDALLQGFAVVRTARGEG